MRPVNGDAMKTTSGPESVRQHFNRFAATLAVGLLAMAWPVDAQIVYTRTNITIGPNASYNLDVNNDGVTDFTITSEVFWEGYPPEVCVAWGDVSEGPAAGNGALIGPLSEGDEIGPEQVFNSGGTILESFSWPKRKEPPCPHLVYSGPWHVVLKGKRYLGLMFQMNGETYYGWAQLTLLDGGVGGAKLSGYAYENTPGMPINAGQE